MQKLNLCKEYQLLFPPKEAIEKRVTDDMQIQADDILNDFISKAVPVTWRMVTACLPVISCISHNDEYTKQVEAASGLACTLPALYACFDPVPKQNAAFLPKGRNVEPFGSIKLILHLYLH